MKSPGLSQNLLPFQIFPDCASTVEVEISATPQVANNIAAAPATAITLLGNLNIVFIYNLFLVVQQIKKNDLKTQILLVKISNFFPF
ncbi:MAG: hypothetical protein ACXIT9_03380 [Nitritalea sp.]